MNPPRALVAAVLLAAALSPSALAQGPEAAPYLIADDGVGPVKLGMTAGELRAAVPRLALEHVAHFSGEIAEAEAVIVDGEAIARVTLGGPGEPAVDYVFTSSPRARTAEGVGPGSLLSEAVAVYGKATITISVIELREYVTFEDHPGRLAIRVGARGDGAGRAGVYREGEGAGAETAMFRDDAVILSIEL